MTSDTFISSILKELINDHYPVSSPISWILYWALPEATVIECLHFSFLHYRLGTKC